MTDTKQDQVITSNDARAPTAEELQLAMKATQMQLRLDAKEALHADVHEVNECKIVAKARLAKGTRVYDGEPIIKYAWNEKFPMGVLASLNALSNREIVALFHRLAALYPREESDMLRSLRTIAGVDDAMARLLIKQPEHVISRYLRHNRFALANDDMFLYVQGSKFNHACRPNCTWSIDSKTNSLVVTAATDITAGEECTICYMLHSIEGAPLATLDTRQRQLVLRLALDFECTCADCRSLDTTTARNAGDTCHNCGRQSPKHKCAACRQTAYCDKACQRAHWKAHKPNCTTVQSAKRVEET